jgi:hypothetical protein
MNFLRWLILERFFGDDPILAMDSDIVWRADPYEFLNKWKAGGSFLCFSSTCLVFIKGRHWYESYRDGLDRMSKDPTFGREYSKSKFVGLYHDQALCQYLSRQGVMENDKANLTGHGLSEAYLMTANPLVLAPAPSEERLSFAKSDNGEFINGKKVPFWHMQTSFSRYLGSALIIPAITGLTHFRIPFEQKARTLPADLSAELLKQMYFQIASGEIVVTNPKFLEYTSRSGQYDEFFDGDLASTVFTDEKWWRPGVWLPKSGGQPAL